MSSCHYVPRLILRKFSDRLSLYNVKTGELKENIPLEHAYAIENFYDAETEKKLNLRIESQFGGLLSNLILKRDKEISLSRANVLLVKKFLLISILRSIQGEDFMQAEKYFYAQLNSLAKCYTESQGLPFNEDAYVPPFVEKQIDGATSFEYWMRTLNVILDTNGTPQQILEHPRNSMNHHILPVLIILNCIRLFRRGIRFPLLFIDNHNIIQTHIQNLWSTALSMQRRFANMKKVNRKVDYEMGKFIWSIVDKSGISQEKWAEILEVSPRMIGYYCSGQRKPTQRKLLRIIKTIGGIKAKDIPF